MSRVSTINGFIDCQQSLHLEKNNKYGLQVSKIFESNKNYGVLFQTFRNFISHIFTIITYWQTIYCESVIKAIEKFCGVFSFLYPLFLESCEGSNSMQVKPPHLPVYQCDYIILG